MWERELIWTIGRWAIRPRRLENEQRDYVETIKSCANVLLNIINDILDFSKIEAGKLSLEMIEFDLHAAIHETLRTLALRAHRSNVELIHDIRPETPVRIIGPSVRLMQVIVNLVGNAVKFTHEGEVVLAVSPPVEVGHEDGGLHVLVVDDNPVNRKLAERMLMKLGHSPVMAASGAEALSRIEQQRFDTILMDVQMPDMDGLAATEEIRRRELESGNRIRVVALTAHAMPSDRDSCLTAGMDGFLSKPIDLKALRMALEEAGQPVDCRPAG